MTTKEQAKSTFVDKFSKLPQLEPDQFSSLFNYIQSLNCLLDNLYDTAFDEGFQKAVNIDVNKN